MTCVDARTQLSRVTPSADLLVLAVLQMRLLNNVESRLASKFVLGSKEVQRLLDMRDLHADLHHGNASADSIMSRHRS